MGWFKLDQTVAIPTESTKAELVWEEAKKRLKESDWSVLSDVPMTSGKKAEWIEYRRALREIKLQTGFPNEVRWPDIPT